MNEKVRVKRFFAILLSFALVLQMGLTIFPQTVIAEEEETVTFDVTYSDTELKRGDEITVTVNMPENNGQAIEAELQYDAEKLEVVSKTSRDGLSGTNGDTAFADVTNLTGKVKLVAVLSSVDTHFKGGQILEVTFKVKDTATVGGVGLKFICNDVAYESRTEVEGQLASHSITGIVPQKADAMVVVPLTGLVLDKSSLALNKGETATLTVEKQPADATADSITWTSSDTSVATVKDGELTTATYLWNEETENYSEDAEALYFNVVSEKAEKYTNNNYDFVVTPTKESDVEESFVLGDLNEDGAVKINDMLTMLHGISGSQILNEKQQLAADIDKDTKVTVRDMLRVMHYISGASSTL